MCAEYESVISSKLECEEPVCESRKKITIDGTCELCEDFMIPSEYGYECYQPSCPERQVVLKDGTCEMCPEHSKVSENQ